jgi:hypothetical protein
MEPCCGVVLTSFEFLKTFLVVFQQLTEVKLLPLCTRPLKCLSSGWSLLVTIYKNDDKTDFSNYHNIQLSQASYKTVSDITLKVNSYVDNLLGIISVGFDVTDQLQMRFFAYVRCWRRNGSIMRQYISYLQILKKSYNSVMGKYCTIISLSAVYPCSQPFSLITMCLHETYN